MISEKESGVQEFNSSGALINTLHPPGQPSRLAADPSGDVFVGTEVNAGEPNNSYEFAAYNAEGTHYAEVTSPLLKRNGYTERYTIGGMAIGEAADSLYASNYVGGSSPRGDIVVMPLPELGPPTVSEEKVSNIEPTTATIHAVVNPEGYDTHYHFQYVDQASFEHEGGFSSPKTKSTTSTDLGLVIENDSVLAPLSALQPETAYHYRAVAESECEPTHPGHICIIEGPDETFTSLPAVSVRNFTTQTVGPELVELKAELNPNGTSSNYTIRYGKTDSYSGGSTEGTLSVGNEFEKIEATFSGLSPNTEYHYQLIAHNDTGEVKTVDQTFTTELSSAEEREAESCSNTNLREEDSALALPDCRDYEQVSPTEKAGYPVLPPNELAPSGERDAFQSLGAFAGAEASLSLSTQRYVAHRTAVGWVTQPTWAYAAGPHYQPLRWEEGGFNAALDSWLFSVVPGSNSWATANYAKTIAFYEGNADGSYVQATTLSVANLPPGLGLYSLGSDWARPVAKSEDFSKIFIGSEEPYLASDPRPGVANPGVWAPDRIYEVAGAGDPSPTLSLAAEVPLGLESKEGSAGTGCILDEQDTDSEFAGRPSRETSADGSVLFYTGPVELIAGGKCGEGSERPNPIALFACDVEAGPCAGPGAHAPIQLNAPPSSQRAPSSPCHTAVPKTPGYYGASPDGKLAWFTTAQPLIDSTPTPPATSTSPSSKTAK